MALLIDYSFKVMVYENREAMGRAAARDAGAYIKKLLNEKDEVNCIFAAAPSQNEFLKYLCEEDIDWARVNAFHMDEYLGLPDGDNRLFSSFLNEKIFKRVLFKKVYYINEEKNSTEHMMARYAELLSIHPVDATFMGIGENGHIAFNDPHAANFADPEVIKIVDLDEKCRMQQVHDGCFESINAVPQYAVTLTIPCLMKASRVFCIVPSNAKADAVRRTVLGEVSEECPATIMRRHDDAKLYLDRESGKYLL